MEQQLEQIEHLLSVFDERERLKQLCNKKIAQLLTPTALGALFELIGLPDENVIWEDFFVIESVLVIQTTITYDPSKGVSPFLAQIGAVVSGEKTPIQIHKQIQFGIPLTKLFDDKEHLKEWFIQMLQSSAPELEQPHPAPTSSIDHFDGSQLSKEQLAQLLYFQKLHGDPQ